MKNPLWFLALILIIIAIFVISGKKSGHLQELEKQEARFMDSLDVRNAREAHLRDLDSTIVREMTRDMDSLKTALNASNAKQRKYAQIKPLILPTDAELDGKIAALYGYRRPL